MSGVSVWKVLAILSASLAFALALMTAAYCIPQSSMEDAAQRSADTLAGEGYYPKVISRLNGNIDTWTDSIMVNTASYESGDNPLVSAMRNARAVEGTR